MTLSLQFELVSPEKLLVSKAVAMVVVPGGEGDYGVMPGHTSMITNVRPGVVAIYEADAETLSDRIFISGGFAEVTSERCTLLADNIVVPVRDFNRSEVEEEVKNLRGELTAATPGAEYKSVETRLAVAEAKLLAVSSS